MGMMMARYNIGFELVFGKKIGTVVEAENMDAAIAIGRERISSLPMKPGSCAQACDDGAGDEWFYRLYEMRNA